MTYPVLSYAAARKWEPLAAKRGVSQVARSSRGFMRAYQHAGSWANLPEAWKRRRDAFVARHMAQVRQNREQLWQNGQPSRRALALIMWAYMPPHRPKSNPSNAFSYAIRGEADNKSSIPASLNQYRVLPGIHTLPMSEFNGSFRVNFYSASDRKRVDELKAKISQSGWVSPLIAVRDAEGYYILEGAHRMVALYELGADSLPALVVLDLEEVDDGFMPPRRPKSNPRRNPAIGPDKAMKPKKARKNPYRRPAASCPRRPRADGWDDLDMDEDEAAQRALQRTVDRLEEERRSQRGSLHDSLDRIGRMVRRRNPIPVEVAEALPYSAVVPQTDEFVQAVANTKGAELTSKGLKIAVTRCQKPAQHDMPSVRSAVFYLPAGDKRLSHYRKKGSWYGGSDCITGTTLLKRPLVVRGATGGKVPEAALKALTGDKKAPDKLDASLRELIRIGWRQSRADLLPQVEQALQILGGSPHLAEEIVEHSTEGNTLNYAVRENIICTMARKAGFDSIVGWSHGSKTGYFLSEVIDLRESFYPAPWGSHSVHREFKTVKNPRKNPESLDRDVLVKRPKEAPLLFTPEMWSRYNMLMEALQDVWNMIYQYEPGDKERNKLLDLVDKYNDKLMLEVDEANKYYHRKNRAPRRNPEPHPLDPVYHGTVDRPERVPPTANDSDTIVVWRDEYNRWECWYYDSVGRTWAYAGQDQRKDPMIALAKQIVR